METEDSSNISQLIASGILYVHPDSMEMTCAQEAQMNPKPVFKACPVVELDDSIFNLSDLIKNQIKIELDSEYSLELLYGSSPTVNLSLELSSAATTLPGHDQDTSCPQCFETSSLLTTVMHLNDLHKWTREEIANWLDELADKGEIDIDF